MTSQNQSSAYKRSMAVLVLCTYLTLILVPNWWPGVGESPVYSFYILSLAAILPLLVGLAVWAGCGLLYARARHVTPNPKNRSRIRLAALGLIWFICVVAVGRWVNGGLPAGSGLLSFDPVVWQQAESSSFVKRDITPRQKMLGDVVKNVLPGRNRAELEKLLGPSLDTAYFKDTGRQLIYRLGPERGSYIRIDSEWLLIWLDGSGRFARYEVYRD